MRRERIICILLIIALAFVNCSCKASNPASPSNAVDSDKDIILTVWAWAPGFNGKAIEIAQRYYSTEHPNVKVNIVAMSSDETISQMNIKFTSRDYTGLPDIVLIEDYQIQGYLQLFPGEIRALSPTINPDDFMDCKTMVSVYDGKFYGVPFDSGVASLFYRTDYIEQAGFTGADMENLTWDIAADFLTKTLASNLDLINELASEIYLVGTLKAAGSLPNYSMPNKTFGNQMVLKDLFDLTTEIPPVNYGLYTYSIDRVIENVVQVIMQGSDIDETLQNAQIMAEAI